MVLAAVLQLVSTFAPAAHVRLVGPVSFVRLPTAGAAIVGLAVVTITAAGLPRRWWRMLPGLLTGAILWIVYWRLRHAPSGTFIDPVLRHTLRPSWGFMPLGFAAFLSAAAAMIGWIATPRRTTTVIEAVSLDATVQPSSPAT